MPLPRLITLIVSLVLVIGLMLWLVESFSRIYWQLSYYSPLLGTLLVLLLIVLLVVLIGAVVYYVLVIQGAKKRSLHQGRRRVPQIPQDKTEAAEETLRAVRQQVDQIQDEVARQA